MMPALKTLRLGLLPGVLFVLSGCGLAQDMREVMDEQQQVSAALKEELGVEPAIGWNLNNGVLTSVSVYLPAEALGHYTVAELAAVVNEAVAAGFEKTPQQVVVSLGIGDPD